MMNLTKKTDSMTENRFDYMSNMPKQGFKSDEQLNQELTDEEETKERKGKGKTLLTSKY